MNLQLAPRPLNSVPFAAKFWDRSVSSTYADIQNGSIPVVRVGGRIKIRGDVLEAIAAGLDPWSIQQAAQERVTSGRSIELISE